MAEDKGSSQIDIDSLDTERNIHIIEALTTPFPQNTIRAHAATLRKLKDQEEWIKEQQRKIQELNSHSTLRSKAHTLKTCDATRLSLAYPRFPPLPLYSPKPPGPHRLQMKPERPEDIAYRARLEEQKSAEKTMGHQELINSPDALLSIFQSLTKVLKDNNQHLQSSDVTEPTKFNDLNTHWDDFYLQLRTYLEAKGWLTTFDHSSRPGTPGFDEEKINKKC